MENQLDDLWEKVLTDINLKVQRTTFNTLFRPTSLLSLDDGIATVAAPSVMVRDLLQKRFHNDITTLLEKHSGQNSDLIFIIKEPKRAKAAKTNEAPLFMTEEAASKTPMNTAPQPLSIGHLPRVRPEFTFQTFAVSGSNQLAFASAQTVSQNIGKAYNPLFIYGPVGVGKTHLMHAIANEVYQKDPSKKIVYITSEEFTNEVVDSIRSHETAKMKRRFRSANLLMIDDIQFIEGKEATQEEIFHTFNILIDNGSQICLSSDRPPHEIKRLEKRLSSRFAGGLTVDIATPDFELKAAIIAIKAKRYGYEIPPDVAILLAENAEDTRSLEGLILRVITQATTAREPVTLELAKHALGAVREEKRRNLHPDAVIKAVCDFYSIKTTQIKGPKRDASLVKARQVCMYLLKNELGVTLAEIGNLLGGRDHTTIMHGVEKIDALVQNKAQIVEDVMGIKKEFFG